MDQKEQETMDGSPAFIRKTLTEVTAHGKFAGQGEIIEGQLPVIEIRFQAGPLPFGVNGCSIEDVIDVLVNRLEGYQLGAFRCRENALAITKLEEAKQWLLYRTGKRQAQGVEGTNAAHKS